MVESFPRVLRCKAPVSALPVPVSRLAVHACAVNRQAFPASSVCRVHKLSKCCFLSIACSRSCGVRDRIFLSRHTACKNAATFDAHKRHYRRTLCSGFAVCRAHRYRADHRSTSASWRLLLVLVPSHSGSLLLPVHHNPIQHGAQ